MALCGVVWCGVVWCGVEWCGVVWGGVVWCGVVWGGVGGVDSSLCGMVGVVCARRLLGAKLVPNVSIVVCKMLYVCARKHIL